MSFTDKENGKENGNINGYYYTEDDYCYYIQHTEATGVKLPLQKENARYVLSETAVAKMIKELNRVDSNLIYDYQKILDNLI